MFRPTVVIFDEETFFLFGNKDSMQIRPSDNGYRYGEYEGPAAFKFSRKNSRCQK